MKKEEIIRSSALEVIRSGLTAEALAAAAVEEAAAVEQEGRKRQAEEMSRLPTTTTGTRQPSSCPVTFTLSVSGSR